MATSTPGNVGPYRLLNVVHTGQTSQIWQAYHDVEQRIYGLKMLLEKFRHDKEHLGYLRWEAAVGLKVQHERIIHIYGLAVDRGTPYVAMEWFPAPNMKRRILGGIERMGHLVPKIIEQAAEAVSHFNEAGWVHRDIKPDNFLVSDTGDVKLIDFALAQRVKGGLGKLLAARPKVQGTRSYMSPEQIRGQASDIRADVYSFGCTMHELICGKPPFTGASADDLLRKHLRASPPSLEMYNHNVTPEFADLVRRCLLKDPRKRPQSAEEFLGEYRMIKVYRAMPKPPEKTPAAPP